MPNITSHCADNGVATLCINREAKRNSLNRATLEDLCDALDRLSADEAVRVIVLRGAGDRSFCAGADLREVLECETLAESRAHFDGVRRVIEKMQNAPQPTVSRVSGFALAGGCGLAVATDFTIAGHDAVFGLPEIELGLLPLIVSEPIYRAVGSRKTLLDLALTGRRVEADEAMRLGLVTRVVDSAELDAEIASLTATLAGFSASALRMGKEALYTMCELDDSAAMKYLREMTVIAARSEDAAEGISAFFEKRTPAWKGR
ncbi:MAG: enoyl-CoA hydratase/isomerase family protein [Deltaproteobacteria bacterium]|nr:enoyl-CoA hydratase/isomerase family protein [Deltaproteobacteria bacterium]MBW2291143.1 enoyl-CoA hydratase/isomerase family protein [Deltaproteobacteria bacterium]MBW2388632.1 enoyl-CoA hydratase/isomerase family protein [Deltaproteobacteria bacterium]